MILDLFDHHPGGPLQQFGHDAPVGGIEVLDDDEGHAAVVGHMAQKLLQGFQTAGGSANADDREGLGRGWRQRFRRRRRDGVWLRVAIFSGFTHGVDS